MRTTFDEQLKLLNDTLIVMGNQCQDCITYATQALITENYEMADIAIRLEKEIDDKQRDIQDICTKLLLRQQPVARDLKIIQAALKMIVDMERIGDQGSDIAEIIKRNEGDKFSLIKLIAQMSDAVIKMLYNAVSSFVQRDEEKAKTAIACDCEVDQLFYKIKTELIEMISRDKKSGNEALETLMLAKYLERIGDHTVNVAEEVVRMLG